MFPEPEPDFVPLEKRWRREKLKPGETCKGFKVGPVVVAWVHWNGEQSKPCHHAISGGKLSCACTTTGVALRKLGFVPLQTIRGENIVVVVSNGVAAIVKPLKQGAAIQLHKSLKPGVPFRYSVWPDYECGAEHRKKIEKYTPVDIKPWLLIFWGDHVLQRFFCAPQSVDTTPPPVASLKPMNHTDRAALVTQVTGLHEEQWNPAKQG